MDALLERCRELARYGSPELPWMAGVLCAGEVDASALRSMRRPDPARPYGRWVFLDTPELEGMIATWSRASPCAPHDHGGSAGAVRVLQGAAVHTVWSVADGRLRVVSQGRVGAGDVIVCGPDLVHSMKDAGDAEPLMTLHLYTRPIDHMVVYDRAARRTYVVDGRCGAWVPLDAPRLIRRVTPGLVPAAHLLAG